MKKEIEIHILKLDESVLDAFCAFTFDNLYHCPEYGLLSFRTKEECTEDEERILSLIPNVDGAINLHCPIVCSGLRGDGSRYRKRCKHFVGYGKNNDQVFSFSTPQKYIGCKKYGHVEIEEYASQCVKQRIIVAAARGKGLIHHFGSAALEKVKKTTCLKCNHFNKQEGCLFKPGCKRGENYILCIDMEWCYGDCDSCEKNEEKRIK